MAEYIRKRQFSVRVSASMLRWLDHKIEAQEFASYSHAFRRMAKIYKIYRRLIKKKVGG